MIAKLTRRRVIGALVVLAVAGALGGSVALRLAKKNADGAAQKVPVVLEFAPEDLTHVAVKPIARWLPVSGALQPVN